MTPLRVSIFAAIAAILLLFVILELIRSRRLQERYALLWVMTALVLLVFALWRDGLNVLAKTVGIAYPPRVVGRLKGEVRVETLERVGAEIVRRGIGPVPAAVEEQAGTKRVAPAHVVQVGSETDRSGVLSAGHLGTSAREGVVHADRRRFQSRLVG